MTSLKLQLIFVGVLLTCVAGYVRFNAHQTSQLKQALSVANEAYEGQLIENAKSIRVFNTVQNANFEKSSAIIKKLDEKLAFELKRANSAEEMAQQALTDSHNIQAKHTLDLKNLTGLLNEKTHTCVTANIPPDYVDWLHQLSP